MTSEIAPILLILFFALLVLALAQLARIQKEAIGHSRGISAAEAGKIFDRDYSDGDGVQFRWTEMRAYCRSTGRSGRLRFWIAMELASVAGGIGSILLDHALR
jgi:hypothetical protein